METRVHLRKFEQIRWASRLNAEAFRNVQIPGSVWHPRRNARIRWRRQGPRLLSPPASALYAKVLTLNYPSGLALNSKPLATNLRFAPLQVESLAPAGLLLHLTRGVRMRGLPSGPQADPVPHSLLFLRNPRSARGLQPNRVQLQARQGRSHKAATRGQPWLASHLLHLVKVALL